VKRYRQEGLPGVGKAKEYDRPTPKPITTQGWLSLDGSALGPLFNQLETNNAEGKTRPDDSRTAAEGAGQGQ
jgi:hypothetical protein